MKKTNRRKHDIQPKLFTITLQGKCPKCKEEKEVNVILSNPRNKVQLVLCTECVDKYYNMEG